jgi:hypothetical protein
VSELPIIRQAQRDRGLGRLALAAFDVLRDRLDLVEFRPVKLEEMEAALDRSRPQVVRALRELTTQGYLERGARAWSRGPYLYRLRYSKHRGATPQAAPPPPAAPPPREPPRGYGMVSKGVDW